ncbi:uncharacterized protein N7484_005320 [Penicillium longicatenatum]|uniref:uncharacterized protein n=1 Tax=Penicillium longicatenatum TaxID=1561947 RepID=UPI002548A3BF|nr:uncharacterized protein N7484_005320 [Penicillium longicatenatum]KAJ5651597.1 hypothetical protein N7484_005320 [Penicillium longicatenatum]
MGGIRKVSQPKLQEDFRGRLARALSLSSSDSESAQSSSRSAEGDTAEIESLQDENGFSSLQHGANPVGSISQDITEDWIQGEELGEELNIQGEPESTDSRTMIAFQCIAELDTRVKSIQGSLSPLTDKIETIFSDLEDIVHRLVAMEEAIETMASDGQDTTEERKMTERTRRRQ